MPILKPVHPRAGEANLKNELAELKREFIRERDIRKSIEDEIYELQIQIKSDLVEKNVAKIPHQFDIVSSCASTCDGGNLLAGGFLGGGHGTVIDLTADGLHGDLGKNAMVFGMNGSIANMGKTQNNSGIGVGTILGTSKSSTIKKSSNGGGRILSTKNITLDSLEVIPMLPKSVEFRKWQKRLKKVRLEEIKREKQEQAQADKDPVKATYDEEKAKRYHANAREELIGNKRFMNEAFRFGPDII